MKTGRKQIEDKDFATLRAEKSDQAIEEAKNMTDEQLLDEISIYFSWKGWEKVARYLTKMYVLRQYNIITDVLTDEIKAYSDEEKYFVNIGSELIKKLLTNTIGQNNSRTVSQEVLHLLRTETYVKDEELEKAAPYNLIPFKNGILDITTNKLLKHDPKFMFTFQLPLYLDPTAQCPKIEKFISEIVKEEDISLVYDIFALSLYRVNLWEKFFILTGAGSNGKSRILKLLELFVGTHNQSSITLQQLTEDKFSVAKTYKKLVNIGADIGQGVIKDTSILKSACSTDRISGQFKFGQIFDFVPTALLIFSANDPPIFADDSKGMYRRIELIFFPYEFGNEEDCKENPNCKRADPNILDEITTPQEMSGLLNKALEHLKNILATGQLSVVKSTTALRKDYVKYSNSIQAFIEECCQEVEYIPPCKELDAKELCPAEGFLWVEEIYPKYSDFCDDNKLPKKAKDVISKFIRKMEGWNLEVGCKDWRYNKDNKKRSIRGLKFKGDSDE